MNKHFGVVVSGGPAPGINAAIASIVIEAANQGYRTFGFVNGFKDVCLGNPGATTELSIPDVTPFAAAGGSLLGTETVRKVIINAEIARILKAESQGAA